MSGQRFIAGSSLPGTPGDRRWPPSAASIHLPDPDRTGGMGLWEALDHRRSTRRFSDRTLGLSVLSQLLWAQNGPSGRFRTAPSAGALFPIQTRVLPFAVEDLLPGHYLYDVSGHALVGVSEGQTADDFASACLDQEVCRQAVLGLVWTADMSRTGRYGERAYRYVFLDAGHIGQNLHLAAESLGLGVCMIGAFRDPDLAALVGVSESEFPVYAAAVGWKT